MSVRRPRISQPLLQPAQQNRGLSQDDSLPERFPEVEGVSGAFFSNKGIAIKSSKLTYDDAVAKRLWNVSAELTHLGSAT